MRTMTDCRPTANDIRPEADGGAMAYDGRRAIIDIDEDEKTVFFDTYKLKKITGTRVAPILGLREYSTPFKVACELAGLYPGDGPNKYIDAGNILEPVLRDHIGNNVQLLREPLKVAEGSRIAVEEPVPMEQCGYDHFHHERVFGGLVDGYVQVDGKRDTILEIKTSAGRDRWLDDAGEIANVPMSYMLQASLYAELSRLDRIAFVVGFLEEEDYERPKRWIPSADNTAVIVKEKLDMSDHMARCIEWYDEFMKGGFTPEWTEADAKVLKYLKAYKPR